MSTAVNREQSNSTCAEAVSEIFSTSSRLPAIWQREIKAFCFKYLANRVLHGVVPAEAKWFGTSVEHFR